VIWLTVYGRVVVVVVVIDLIVLPSLLAYLLAFRPPDLEDSEFLVASWVCDWD
jgi:hypothetical protein